MSIEKVGSLVFETSRCLEEILVHHDEVVPREYVEHWAALARSIEVVKPETLTEAFNMASIMLMLRTDIFALYNAIPKDDVMKERVRGLWIRSQLI